MVESLRVRLVPDGEGDSFTHTLKPQKKQNSYPSFFSPARGLQKEISVAFLPRKFCVLFCFMLFVCCCCCLVGWLLLVFCFLFVFFCFLVWVWLSLGHSSLVDGVTALKMDKRQWMPNIFFCFWWQFSQGRFFAHFYFLPSFLGLSVRKQQGYLSSAPDPSYRGRLHQEGSLWTIKGSP